MCKNIKIESYPVWIYIADIPDDGEDKPAQPDMNLTFKMAKEIILDGKSSPKIGIQMESMPFQKWDFLVSAFGKDNIVDCEPVLRRVRAIKTDWEINVLRDNAKMSERAMFETYQRIEPGMTEVEINSIWNERCFAQSKDVYAVTSANTFASYWSPQIIPAENYTVQKGDIIRLDGGVWRKGYGSDLGRAYAIGGKAKTAEMERVYAALLAGYDKLISMIGPGVRMCDVFKEALAAVKKAGIPAYKRGHFGHSMGCNRFAEEYPFISATETGVFESGMVFCTEIPYYSSFNHTYNLEDELVITEDGFELFTNVPRDLNWIKV